MFFLGALNRKLILSREAEWVVAQKESKQRVTKAGTNVSVLKMAENLSSVNLTS